jgi:tetratricopeptide (TPR) repeat protein
MSRFLIPLPLLLAGALAACGGYGQPNDATSQLAFGTSMAKRGLWSEALFRFHEAERLDPENARVQNNLGVAYEATGQFDQALQHYQHALKLEPNSREVKNNYARFVEFYQSFRPKKNGQTAAGNSPGAGGATMPKGKGGKDSAARSPSEPPPDLTPGPLGEPEPEGPEPASPPPPPV